MAAEAKLQKYVVQEIARLGGMAEKFSSPSHRGVPDLLVSWPALRGNAPMVEFIEMKAPGGRVTLLQQKDHERRRKMGFQVHVLASEAQVEEYLRSRGKP